MTTITIQAMGVRKRRAKNEKLEVKRRKEKRKRRRKRMTVVTKVILASMTIVEHWIRTIMVVVKKRVSLGGRQNIRHLQLRHKKRHPVTDRGQVCQP